MLRYELEKCSSYWTGIETLTYEYKRIHLEDIRTSCIIVPRSHGNDLFFREHLTVSQGTKLAKYSHAYEYSFGIAHNVEFFDT